MADSDGSAKTLNPYAFHLQKLGLELKCPVCWKLLDKPTLLPCDHIFCCSCVPKSSQFSTQCPTCNLNFIDQDMKSSSYLENIVTIYKSLDAAFSSSILPILCTKSGTPATISTPSEQKRKRQCGVTSNVKCEQAASFLDNHGNCPVSKELGVKHVPVASPGSFPSPAEHHTNDKDAVPETENHDVENSVDNGIGTAVDGLNDANKVNKRGSKKQKKLNFGSSKAVLQSHGHNQKIVPDSDRDAAPYCNDKCGLKEGTSLDSSAAPCNASDLCKKNETENHDVENSVDNGIGTAVDGLNDANKVNKRGSKKQKKLNFGSSKAVLQSHGHNQKIVPDSDRDAAPYTNDLCGLKEGTSLDSSAAPCNASDVDRSVCAFCHLATTTKWTGPVQHYAHGKEVQRGEIDFPSAIAVHINCLLWTPRVYCNEGVFQNLESELERASRLKCFVCGLKGAALGCFEKLCRRSYHVPCAVEIPDCRWDCENYLMLCPKHESTKFPSEKSDSRKHQSEKECPSSTQRSEGDLASPQPKFGETSPKGPLVFCLSALASNEMVLLTNFAAKCGSTVFKFWDPSVTHVFTSTDLKGACKRTKEVLMAILNGRWILTTDWIEACLETNVFVDEEPYEVNLDDCGSWNGPRTGRLMASIKAPKLFDGSIFYFHGDFTNKSDLLDLVTAGGGTVVQSVEELVAQSHSLHYAKMYVVYNGDFPRGHVEPKAADVVRGTDAWPIPHTWILGSIAGCKAMPCDKR